MGQQPTWNFNLKSNVTIAGQTAPGDGILLKNGTITLCANFNCGTPIAHWIIRHLRIAGGQNGGFAGQGLTVYNGHDVMIDHVSVRWATDDSIGATVGSYNVTWQWSIIAEPLNDAPSNPGQPSKIGQIDDSDATANFSFVRNLFANSNYRAPSLASSQLQNINNVVYNIKTYGAQLVPSDGVAGRTRILADFIGNYYLRGPNTDPAGSGGYNAIATFGCNDATCNTTANSRLYVLNNYHNVYRPTGTEPQSAVVIQSAGAVGLPLSATPTLSTANYTVTSAAQARTDVLAQAGAYAVAAAPATVRRDGVDQRQVNDVNNGTGRLPQTEDAVCGNDLSTAACGFGTYRNGVPYTDTDGDGMADDWEIAHGLNPNDPSDGPLLSTIDKGYTNLEVFLNWLAGDYAQRKLVVHHPMPTHLRLVGQR